MATLGNPPAQNTLGQIRDEVQAEIDFEVNGNLIDRWINREIESLTTKREFSHFFKRSTAILGTQDPDTGISILPLPADLKKVFSISTKDQNFTEDTTNQQRELFRQGYHYELFWNVTRGAWDGQFKVGSVGSTNTTLMDIDYYLKSARLLGDDDITRIAEFYSNVIALGVLKRCYRKLGDMTEYEITAKEYKTELQSMIDDDAREQDLPEQMSPSRRQGADEYTDYLDLQKHVNQTFWQNFQ